MAIAYSVTHYVFFIVVVTLLVKPLGGYVERVFTGKRTLRDRFLLPPEKFLSLSTPPDAASSLSGNKKGGRHVDLDFYDLLIEGHPVLLADKAAKQILAFARATGKLEQNPITIELSGPTTVKTGSELSLDVTYRNTSHAPVELSRHREDFKLEVLDGKGNPVARIKTASENPSPSEPRVLMVLHGSAADKSLAPQAEIHEHLGREKAFLAQDAKVPGRRLHSQLLVRELLDWRFPG